MKSIVIAVAAAKGGVSKTTTFWALGTLLSQKYPTLIIDHDPQGSLSSAVLDDPGLTAFDVLVHKKNVNDVIQPALAAYGGNLFVVPASPLLAGIEPALATDLDRQHVLADALDGLYGFRYVVLDCPSAQNLLTTFSLVAADIVLSPLLRCMPSDMNSCTLVGKEGHLLRS